MEHNYNLMQTYFSLCVFRYGTDGLATKRAFDCLVIPNAVTEDGVPAHAVCPFSNIRLVTWTSFRFTDGKAVRSICVNSHENEEDDRLHLSLHKTIL